MRQPVMPSGAAVKIYLLRSCKKRVNSHDIGMANSISTGMVREVRLFKDSHLQMVLIEMTLTYVLQSLPRSSTDPSL